MSRDILLEPVAELDLRIHDAILQSLCADSGIP